MDIFNKSLFSLFISVVFFFSGCSEYAKIQKSTDLDKKYAKAIYYFEKGDFVKANTLLEELVGLFRGTAKAEDVNYYYAKTQFELGDYILAGYHFKNFVKLFSTSSKAEECAYLAAYCYYLSSPAYSLDQTDTKSAIREFQFFIDKFPKSARIAECNMIMDKLREKLEQKSYEIAKQYYFVEDYKASIYAFTNTLKEFPDSKYREEMMFLLVKSNYLLSLNSIDSKKAERYKATIEAYLKFVDSFQKSNFMKEAQSIYENTLKKQEKS